MLMVFRFLMLTLLFIILNVCIVAQIVDATSKSSADAVGVADFDFAPLQIELTANRRYIKVANRTEATILKFRFGCLRTDGDLSHITKSFTPKILKLSEVTIGPRDMFSFGTELSGIGKCNSAFESLVVSQVTFDDKRRWDLEDHLENIGR